MRRPPRLVLLATTSFLLLSATTARASVVSEERLQSAVGLAKRMGTVERLEAVHGVTDAQARTALGSPETSPPASPQADLVVVYGHFIDEEAPVPPGQPSPEGTVAAFTVGNETSLAWLGQKDPDLTQLGPVEDRQLGPPDATAASRHRHHHRARAATWGNGCDPYPRSHCYAIAQWTMSGGEEVLGAGSQQDTTDMEVYEAPGYFVTNEMWVGFPQKSETWVEIGQKAQGEFGCCTLWWFKADSLNGVFQTWSTPEQGIWQVTPNTWNNFGILAGDAGVPPIGYSYPAGYWCFIIGPNWETVNGCVSGFPPTSKELTDGMEASQVTEPTNAGHVVANTTWTNHTIHNWNKATLKAINWSGQPTSHVCVSKYNSYPGDINYGTC